MKATWTWLLSAAALTGMMGGTAAPAAAQPYGYGYGYDDGPPPCRRGPGWDGPRGWGPGERWRHQRRFRDEGFDRRGPRDFERRGGREDFGNDDSGGRGNRGGARNDDTRRTPGGDDVLRRRQGQGGPNPFGGRDSD